MPLNIDWQQIMLHMFNFVLLFAILYFLLYSPVKKFMEQREQYYKDMDTQAKDNLKKAEQARSEYEMRLMGADEEIDLLKENAMKSAEEAGKLKLQQAKSDAEKIVSNARSSMERERKKMLSDAQNEISDIVADAVEKIVSDSSTIESYDAFLSSIKRGEE